MESIKTLGYATPTPIQQKAIPHVLSGRDLLGLAQTGTGKTAAFALPILHNLYKEKSVKTRVLVIAPTRELAEQIKDSFIELSGKNRINIITVYGGVSMTVQVQNLRRNPDVIVACPGRLLDHLKKGTCDLSGVKTLVLDEADQMFDMGFFPDIKRIIARVPVARQTLLFSATMPAEVRKLTEAVLKDAVTVEVDYAKPVATVEQALYPVNDQTQKTPVLLRLLHKNDSGSVLVFTRTKHRAKRLAEALGKAGHTATSLQGNLSQNQRQIALSGFKSGKFRIMVATDIAARGIDVSLITHVINYDMPATVEAYTHRIGRTGRAERTGSAHTLITSEDHGLVRAIERTLSAKIERRQILHPANQKTA
ncbi:DEAD/DEAH box helicase [bacterium]|nr:MAG: DEAD/DEAH box helicase [bacterium]